MSNFENDIGENLGLIGDVLTEISKELPDLYPSLNDLKGADLSWIWNRYNSKKSNFGESASKIMMYINDYLKIDLLIN